VDAVAGRAPTWSSRADGRLLGSTGFAFETPYRASTSYVFRGRLGRSYATKPSRHRRIAQKRRRQTLCVSSIMGDQRV
jgi:hypothetical protein